MPRRFALLLAGLLAATGASAALSATAHAATPTICIHKTLTHDINVYVCPQP